MTVSAPDLDFGAGHGSVDCNRETDFEEAVRVVGVDFLAVLLVQFVVVAARFDQSVRDGPPVPPRRPERVLRRRPARRADDGGERSEGAHHLAAWQIPLDGERPEARATTDDVVDQLG